MLCNSLATNKDGSTSTGYVVCIVIPGAVPVITLLLESQPSSTPSQLLAGHPVVQEDDIL